MASALTARLIANAQRDNARALDALRRRPLDPGETLPLRTDGPTLAVYVAAGYPADRYSPWGYAPKA